MTRVNRGRAQALRLRKSTPPEPRTKIGYAFFKGALAEPVPSRSHIRPIHRQNGSDGDTRTVC